MPDDVRNRLIFHPSLLHSLWNYEYYENIFVLVGIYLSKLLTISLYDDAIIVFECFNINCGNEVIIKDVNLHVLVNRWRWILFWSKPKSENEKKMK